MSFNRHFTCSIGNSKNLWFGQHLKTHHLLNRKGSKKTENGEHQYLSEDIDSSSTNQVILINCVHCTWLECIIFKQLTSVPHITSLDEYCGWSTFDVITFDQNIAIICIQVLQEKRSFAVITSLEWSSQGSLKYVQKCLNIHKISLKTHIH